MIRFFSQPWQDVPIVSVDTETTGVTPGVDRACSVGLVRFEGGKEVGSFVSLVDPERPIPEAATAIHGIVDADVSFAPTIAEVFERADVKALLDGAQPLAYNSPYDRAMVPPLCEASWPWFDALVLVRVVDAYERGAGRHKLENACKRHGVALTGAHSALADARAAGELWQKLASVEFKVDQTLGSMLLWLRRTEAGQWFDFCSWLAKQPPKEGKR